MANDDDQIFVVYLFLQKLICSNTARQHHKYVVSFIGYSLVDNFNDI